MNGELIPSAYTIDQGRITLNTEFSGTAHFNNVEGLGNVTGGTYYSGATPLEIIITNLAVAGSVTYVQPGLNTYTGGTATNPTVNISAATLTYLSATTFSAGTINSGSTNLYSIFQTIGGGSPTIQSVLPGTNITTGGTITNPTINTVNSPHFNNISFSGTGLGSSFSATTISGGTLYSGSTNLYNIFCTDCVDLDNYLPISGGTVTGQTTFTGELSGGTISGGTLYSGSTDLSSIFAPISITGGTGFSGFSSSTGTYSIKAVNDHPNDAAGAYSISLGQGTTSIKNLSFTFGQSTEATNYGEFAVSNDGSYGQWGFLNYFGSTTLAPSNISKLYLDGGSTLQQMVIPLDSSYFISVSVAARVIGGLADGESAAWTSDGMVKNIGGVVTVPVDTGGNQFYMTAKVLDASFIPPGPTVIISAETATSALTITVIGPDDNVRWYATFNCTKVK